MNDILFLCPLKGNGGIASWTKKFLLKFPDGKFYFHPVNIAPDKDFTKFRGLDRLWYGVKAFLRAHKEIKKTLLENPNIRVMHIASGGGIGIIRDYWLARMSSKRNCKTIIHCHFGNIVELTMCKGIVGYYVKKALDLYDQIWVLDKRSYEHLSLNPKWKSKVFITPNSIDVPADCDLHSPQYCRIGFVGNIVPTKGIFELVEAVASLDNDTELFIAGQGLDEVVEHIKLLAGDKLGKSIHLLGRLSNAEAVKLMESLDIICLPTYYPEEAFPISILEAMSRGKMVISCPKAAIPDMLSSVDGSKCGILVPEKDVHAIAEAILWCQEHKTESDAMCRKAYEKVKTCYDEKVVFDIYKSNYQKLM